MEVVVAAAGEDELDDASALKVWAEADGEGEEVVVSSTGAEEEEVAARAGDEAEGVVVAAEEVCACSTKPEERVVAAAAEAVAAADRVAADSAVEAVADAADWLTLRPSDRCAAPPALVTVSAADTSVDLASFVAVAELAWVR